MSKENLRKRIRDERRAERAEYDERTRRLKEYIEHLRSRVEEKKAQAAERRESS